MAVAFAAKLRMVAVALGCNTRKEFCARFRQANAATQCDTDRLNKWMQGRSMPRSASVHADLAAVMGTPKSGRWVADCSVEEFASELCACTGADPATLSRPDNLARRPISRTAGLLGGIAALSGTFAAYSPAWSPHFKGRVLRGALRLTSAGNGTLVATYTESLFGRDVHLSADASIGARSMYFPLREPAGDTPLFISLQIPGPPASVLCGIMSGSTFFSSEPLPSASRIVFIRVPDTPALPRSNRYFDPYPGAFAADLIELGLRLPEADGLDAFARTFLGLAPIQVSTHDQAAFARILDREHLDGMGGLGAASQAASPGVPPAHPDAPIELNRSWRTPGTT